MPRAVGLEDSGESVDRTSDRLVLLAWIVIFAMQIAHAGGPRWVAGSSYFNSTAKGQPVVWANGQVTYYTDLGNLSAQVSQAQANAMVANAAAVWSSINTAAVSIQRGGSLAEDVNGTNVTSGANGIAMPADIQSTATNRPVAVVYDADGSVINAMDGAGASSSLVCQEDSVLVSVDNLAVTGNIAHALVLVNGLCATTASQIANLQYQLIRAFGRVLGLDWSQTNEQIFDISQIPTDGLAGWPIMHPIERLCNGGGGQCFSSPTQLRTDDIAALNRLYPVTAANIGSFPAKTITASATISVQGTIQFPDGQGMQGVNVVLQPLVNGAPDLRYTASAVSGAYFQGNVGNSITGSTDANGDLLDRFGSDDTSLEGFFDLSGVPLPPGVTASQYQLTFEALNPLYTGNVSVGPYTNGQVAPSGTMPVVALGTLSAGSAITQTVDIDDADQGQSGADGAEDAPATVPVNGEWTARITGYGHSGWFAWWARGGREFTVETEALDEDENNTENKPQMVVGAWNGTDAVGTVPVSGTVRPFNGNVAGLTTLPVLTIADSEVRIGLADFRGDGRPDFAYRGRILYADSVSPPRLPVGGGQMVIQGMGFRPGMTVSVNGVAAPVSSVSPTTIVATAPASPATGNVVVQIQDAQTLGIASIASGVSYDAEPDDAVSLLTAPMGLVPIGAPQPFTVRVINVTAQMPAAGVTVTFAVTEGAAILGCGQSSCNVVTAGDGTATLSVVPNSTALAQVTASLTSTSSVMAEFTGTTPPSIVALTPNLYVALGATVRWPVQALVLNPYGVPVAGQAVSWNAPGSGVSVSTRQNSSDANGLVTNPINAGPFSESVSSTVNACLAGTTDCATFTVTPVHTETAALAPWSGTSQYVSAGQTFSPVVLHVTDAFGHPLAGASVVFAEMLDGWTEPCPVQGNCAPAPVLEQQTVQAVSGIDGSVTLTPIATNGLAGRLQVMAATGDVTLNCELDAHP